MTRGDNVSSRLAAAALTHVSPLRYAADRPSLSAAVGSEVEYWFHQVRNLRNRRHSYDANRVLARGRLEVRFQLRTTSAHLGENWHDSPSGHRTYGRPGMF
jgi:hypothetical protein